MKWYSAAVGWYVRILDNRPWLSAACTTGAICGCGDVLAQQFIEKRGLGRHSWVRTRNMALVGFSFTGPVLRGWFNILDRVFGKTKTPVDAVKKMLTDQVFFAPVLFTCLLPLIGASQGLSRPQIEDKFKKEYLNVLLGCYKLWPAAQMINFYFIPLKYRVNYTNLISLGWNTYLAWLANR